MCAALRAYAVPSSGFVMQPHEDPLPPLGFLDFEQRGQFEARQAVALGFAGECRRPLLALGSLVSAVEDGGFHFLDGGSDVRFPEQLVARPPSTRAGPKLRRPSRPSCVTVLKVATDKLLRSGAQLKLRMALAFFSPARPDPTPGTGAVSGVRLSTAPAQSPPPVERALVGECFQVVKGAPVASRCRQRHALAVEPVVLPADTRGLRCFAMGKPVPAP